MSNPVPLPTILKEWGRIGVLGFGGPPTHIRMLRELTVQRRGWIEADQFEDGIAACNLLPGPASTQLSIYSAWRVGGPVGAILGGLSFIVPGLLLALVLARAFLMSNPPHWLLAMGAGAAAVVPAVAVHAAVGLTGSSWQRAQRHTRWAAYLLAGAVAATTLGPWLVVVLLGCGLLEIASRNASASHALLPFLAVRTGAGTGSLLSLAWVAIKVGLLSYGGGFVIIPLMQSDAVHRYHWVTDPQFLNAVAIGQITPGPVFLTVAVIGYAARGLSGALLGAAVTFVPSFVMVIGGAPYFERLRTNAIAQGFLSGAGPAAIGAIYGAAVPLALALGRGWQYALLAAAAVALLALRRSVVTTIGTGAVLGLLIVQLGAGLPH